ncbi:MAG: alpha/beta fold hydrolase [Clostridia bacterium]|nr:alpha/beta fold hydrolase [Clostridia bacterium]
MRYPILLVHGMGIRDNYKIGYWGRIPKMLENLGCEVYLSGQDCSASVESNCEQIAKRLDDILASTGAKKVNIIAHSKGGLESRYLASSMGYADKIASITTMATPHNGSKTVDTLMKFPDRIIRIGCFFFDVWFKTIGDINPETYKAITGFKTSSAAKFNEENPDQEGIYYQSYAFVMKHFWSDMLIWFPSLVVHHFEGENDGLLPPEAVKWGNFRGIVRSNSTRGISHCDEIDMRRLRLNRKDGDGISDIIDVYMNVAKELEEMGF